MQSFDVLIFVYSDAGVLFDPVDTDVGGTRISPASVWSTAMVSSMNCSSGIACSASWLFMSSVRTQGGAISSTRTVVSRSMKGCERM
jgi:hypothetical protein